MDVHAADAELAPTNSDRRLRETGIDGPFDFLNGPGQWWLVRRDTTRPLQLCIDTIEGCEVPVFCPRQSVRYIRGSEKRIRVQPLFPGWLFANPLTDWHIPLHRWEWSAAEIIKVEDQQRLRRELSDVARLCDFDPFLQCEQDRNFRSGRPVEIVSGGLKGMRGVVETFDGKFKLRVKIITMNTSVTVTVAPGSVDFL